MTTIEVLRREVAARGLIDDVQVTPCGSLGLCERGPNMVVYPEGVWYSGVTPNDVAEIVDSHLREGSVVERLANRDAAALRAEIKSNRDKMLAALRAKAEAGIPPDDIMQTMRAFQESRVLLTAVELNVFTAVGRGGRTVEVANKVGTDPRATEMLLNALVAMGMLTKEGDVFRNTPVAARFFTEGSPHDARAAAMPAKRGYSHLRLTRQGRRYWFSGEGEAQNGNSRSIPLLPRVVDDSAQWSTSSSASWGMS
jgi:(2Fe-2S) ferredoxin